MITVNQAPDIETPTADPSAGGSDDTIIIGPVSAAATAGPTPIFVDATGRRRRRLLRVAYGVSVLGLGYTVLVGVSVAGGPAFPQALLPLPDQVERSEPTPAPTPAPTAAQSLVSAPPMAVTTVPPGTDLNLPVNTNPSASARATRPAATPGAPVRPAEPVPGPVVVAPTPPTGPTTEPTPPVEPSPPEPTVGGETVVGSIVGVVGGIVGGIALDG